MSNPFRLSSSFEPAGDQPRAIAQLLDGLAQDMEWQTLLGVTGSGKTFTMAHVIAEVGRPTLVVSHNKTLAAQLYSELRGFFPEAAVEYFVSYYDYYQPEAYLPVTDTYIEKDADLNEELDRLRLRATTSLLTRRDVVVVASVSCLYGLGNPDTFESVCVSIESGRDLSIDGFLRSLVSMQYSRNDIALTRGTFRVRGDVVDVVPAYRTVKPEQRTQEIGEMLEKGLVDMVTFTSSSTVANFAEMFGPARHGLKAWMEKVVVACIGPITAKTAEEHGFAVHVVPGEYTIEALTQRIAAYFRSSSER
jgi:excinuclease ABC subunit B